MDLLRGCFVVILICSCAKIGYVVKQAPGQLGLIYGARDNAEILRDPNISEKNKSKIRLIKEYKKYFYNFFEKESGEIYSKTKILHRDAVSYLVIASKFDQIEARKECFPFVGCFPYLGFFSEDDAKKYAINLKDEDYQTWIRPVYAYSSLNYFSDPIMSSFFQYNDIQLAELIFHELFHSIFFVKDEVDLNENLANYFSRKMVIQYFNFSTQKINEVNFRKKRQNEISQLISTLANQLNQNYKEKRDLSKKEAHEMLNSFLENRFKPLLKKKCSNLGYEKCLPLAKKWNNASFAAFLTYEKESNRLEELHNSYGKSLKLFYVYIEKQYKEYGKQNKKSTFRDFLLKI